MITRRKVLAGLAAGGAVIGGGLAARSGWGNRPALAKSDVKLLRDWIDQGARNN